MDSYASYSARRHCPIVVCTLPMLLILDVSFPEAYGALGSGGLGRSDVALGSCVKETVIEGLLPWFRIRRDNTCKPGKQYASDATFLK
jgi:hypothetical protein